MNLKQFITDYRLSQKELADVLGCTPTNVSNIASGKRNLTGLHVRLLIEKFGLDVISKYAEPSELPAPASSVNIDMHQTKIEGNQAPVQNGDGNHISTDATLIQVMKQQSDQNSALIAELSKRSEQMDRLISLMEKMKN